ncbi:MAG: hypothetical protein WB988_17640 [Candidatus Nitrosopolaris sp.]
MFNERVVIAQTQQPLSRRSMKKEIIGIEYDRRRLEERIRKVKDLLPLAEQIMRLKIGIGELLAFHSSVYEKADIERIPLDTATYKVVEDIRDYSQLGGLKKEQDRVQQQIYIISRSLCPFWSSADRS